MPVLKIAALLAASVLIALAGPAGHGAARASEPEWYDAEWEPVENACSNTGRKEDIVA